MKKSVSLLGFALMLIAMLAFNSDASAQRRYKHLKRVKTPEGFVEITKTQKPVHVKPQTPQPAEAATVTETAQEQATPAPAPVDETAVASAEPKKTTLVRETKKVKLKSLFREKELAQTATSLVYSNDALAKSGLGKMLAPDKVGALEPGMLLIILGSVMAGIAITMWVVGTVVFFGTGGNAALYILFIVLGVFLWFGGLAMIAVGIVKLIRSRRGR